VSTPSFLESYEKNPSGVNEEIPPPHDWVQEKACLIENAERVIESRYDPHDKSFRVLIRQEQAEEWQGIRSLSKT
jgi:hypothetical protein